LIFQTIKIKKNQAARRVKEAKEKDHTSPGRKMVVIYNKLRSANNILEPKVKALEKELHQAKTELVSLELTCLHEFIKTCDNYKKL